MRVASAQRQHAACLTYLARLAASASKEGMLHASAQALAVRFRARCAALGSSKRKVSAARCRASASVSASQLPSQILRASAASRGGTRKRCQAQLPSINLRAATCFGCLVYLRCVHANLCHQTLSTQALVVPHGCAPGTAALGLDSV